MIATGTGWKIDFEQLLREPVLPPPFRRSLPSKINPVVESVHGETLRWVCDLELAFELDDHFRRLCAARFAWLTALTQPKASVDALKLAADWHTWLFLHDDLMDASAVGLDPKKVLRIGAVLQGILAGAKPRPNDPPLARALSDILQRVSKRGGKRWLRRFAGNVDLYLLANIWESVNRLRKAIPDWRTFRKIRLHTSAVFTCFDIVHLTEGLDPESAIWSHPTVRDLSEKANRHICWVNDILSLTKELRERNPNNLVLVLLQKGGHRSLQTAVDEGVSMCNSEMKAFDDLIQRMVRVDPESGAEVVRVASHYGAWMQGHMDWYSETDRYDAETSSVSPTMANDFQGTAIKC